MRFVAYGLLFTSVCIVIGVYPVPLQLQPRQTLSIPAAWRRLLPPEGVDAIELPTLVELGLLLGSGQWDTKQIQEWNGKKKKKKKLYFYHQLL